MTDHDGANPIGYDEWIALQLVGIRYNVPPEVLLRTLGVQRLTDYTGDFDAACEALRAHAAAHGFGPDGRPL
jgi:hypothetical protein